MSNYEIPKWAGKACQGLHLDVLKSGAFVEKILIDDKIGYFFGRNKDVCDVVIDHASCSRVHALLLYHKHVKRSFIVDLDSSHGTFVNGIRLEAKKPTPVEINSILSFGASTRTYSLREKPETSSASRATMTTTDGGGEENVELPEQEAKLLDLTEYNTAQNKRVSTVGIGEDGVGMVEGKRRRKRSSVHFQEEEEIINPEDVDPNVGRFRNMVQSTVIQPIKVETRPNKYSSISSV
ncbi:nuclear inhibitor of protein phosphatase 1-like [Oscarella lobularis]|uniref:nuclear inhibitor of protein phosphatase 1-like n=1 Tax=Oscarella lobularis TaxID=121494 RepID=UPI00331375F2